MKSLRRGVLAWWYLALATILVASTACTPGPGAPSSSIQVDSQSEAKSALATAQALLPYAVNSATPTRPNVKVTLAGLNVIGLAGPSAGDALVLGEVRNDGEVPLYSATIVARLLTDTEEVVASNQQTFGFLGVGDTIGYAVHIPKPGPFSKVKVQVSSSGRLSSDCSRLSLSNPTLSRLDEGGGRFRFTGLVANSVGHEVTPYGVIWFLDSAGSVIHQEPLDAFPGRLPPGATHSIDIKTPTVVFNPKVATIEQVKTYI